MYEAGPLDLIIKFRHFTGVTHDLDGNSVKFSGIGTVFSCFMCCSIWCAAAFSLKQNLVYWPALSAVAILLEGWYDDHKPL